MKKIYIILMLLAITLLGCSTETETEWDEFIRAKFISIEIVGVGGWGSPNAVRIWHLDNGMIVTMSDWKNEDVCVGDTVAKYQAVSGRYKGWKQWQKTKP